MKSDFCEDFGRETLGVVISSQLVNLGCYDFQLLLETDNLCMNERQDFKASAALYE